ncbi:FAD-dependent urate hydroxylase [Fusarium oxysporum f. sp. albedinis]|nr:FAD-dependent urate hydroxylase [Fusarium oxysporum f. sp. albedinis]
MHTTDSEFTDFREGPLTRFMIIWFSQNQPKLLITKVACVTKPDVTTAKKTPSNPLGLSASDATSDIQPALPKSPKKPDQHTNSILTAVT